MNCKCIKYSWLATSVSLLSVTFAGHAMTRPLDLYLSGGISDPTGSLADNFEVGYHGSAKLGFQLEPRTEFLLGGEIHSMRTDHNRLPTVDADFLAILAGFDVKINLKIPEDPIAPYLLIGGGYANVDFTGTRTSIGGLTFDSDSKSYFEFGGGFELKRAFALFRIVSIFENQSPGASFFSIGIGYKLL